MKNYRKYIFILFAAWLVFSQSYALEHVIEHEVAGHQEACSICLDAAQFSNVDIVPEIVSIVPPSTKGSAITFETASYDGLFFTHYASRAPPSYS